MREKERILLKFFSTHDSWVTSFSAATYLGISVRSVKTYIADINASHRGLIASSRDGFMIQDKQRLADLLRSDKETVRLPETAEDRKKYILRKLLLEQEEYDLEKLALELSISYATLSNELPRLKADLAEYELKFKTKNNRASIDGQEAFKKKMISKLIYEDAQNSFLSIKLMQRYLPNYDLSQVRKIVFSILRQHQYFMDDFSMMNLVLHIAITMERHQRKKVLAANDPDRCGIPVNAHIQQIMQEISHQLKDAFDVAFTHRELHDFSLLIMTRVIQDTASEVTPENLSSVVGDDVASLVTLMQEKAGSAYNITLTNPDFTVRFALHTKNLLIRLAGNIRLRNPQMSEIKNLYPFIHDVAVYMASIITDQTGYTVNEDEISYIALHLGVLIEERKMIKHDVRAVLLNPHVFYDSLELTRKCMQIFSNSLLVTTVVPSEEELETYSDYDMIITTIPLSGYSLLESVQISGHLNHKDILALGGKIEYILKERIKKKVETKIKMMFREEFFYVNPPFRDQNDALGIMADALLSEGFVDEKFKQKLFEREKVSSSAYANIAMPHPLEMSALTSAIGVSLHPGGIQWNNTRVNIVFLLAINMRDRLFFKDIFDFITEVISDENNLKTMLEVKSYDEFVRMLVSFAK